jgi:hypothetical protein
MAITTTYYSGSGASFDNCAFLGQRYEEESGYRPNEAECWICSASPGESEPMVTMHLGSTGWLTQLWRSPSGSIFVSAASGIIYHHREPFNRTSPWQEPQVDAALFGIWGIDDRCVFAWGSRKEVPVFFRWNGSDWSEMPSPKFSVRAVHGLGPDSVYAVGAEGGAALWDGRAWQPFQTPTREILTAVFAAGPDEIYAVGNGGTILEASAAGWGKIGEGPGLPGPLAAVAKFRDELWVGAGQFGLFKRAGTSNRFDCIKPNAHAVDFDVRQQFLITCSDFIGGTADGQSFKLTARGWLLRNRASHPLCDF